MHGDPTRHRSLDMLRPLLDAMPTPSRDRGTVHLVVARLPDELRQTPERARFTVDGGLEGDRWSLADEPKLAKQITLMNVDVACVLSGGQDLAMFGDNVLVDIDLSVEALPTGTQLTMGTARFEVTDEPHTGCKKFRRRFGVEALKVMSTPDYKPKRLRGLYVRVIEDGEVGPGDGIEVLRTRSPQKTGDL